MKKLLFTLFGFFFVALGAVGVLLPVLPTTPFLLLAAACFLRGSSRFREWFQKTQLYQRYAKELIESHTMTKKRKLRILVPVTLLLSVIFFVFDILWVRLILVAAVILKWCYFTFRIKTIRPDDSEASHPLTEPR